MKLCRGCGETKPLTEYDARKESRDGRASKCKACRRTRTNQARHRKAAGLSTWGEKEWNAPDAVYIERKCMCCRLPFKTANDFRMCPSCRAGEMPSFGTEFLCEAEAA